MVLCENYVKKYFQVTTGDLLTWEQAPETGEHFVSVGD